MYSAHAMIFGQPFVKGSPYAIKPLSVCLSVCLSVWLSVCAVRLSVTLVTVVKRYMDQDENSHAGRPRPGHIALDASQLPSPKEHSPQLLAHICCGQMAGWINMQLGMEIGLGPGDIILDYC